MHVLAYVYRWSRDSLWLLSYKERKMWYDMIIKQKEAEKEALEQND
jgi:hypothetical protein